MIQHKVFKRFTVLFSLLVISDLILGTQNLFFRQFTKPAIVGVLIIYFFRFGKTIVPDTQFRWVILGLVFSLVGDVCLLYEGYWPHFFTFGLGAFLIAHVCYCIAFIQQWNSKTSGLFWLILILVLSYGTGLFLTLKNHLGPLLIPVIVYIVLILCMFITALKRQEKVNKSSFLWVVIGALFFIISDSILAIDKFLTPISHSLIPIMTTYAFAQYSIVVGMLQSPRH